MIVKFYATLRNIVGGKAVEIPVEHGVTAKELLDAIIAKFPALKKELFQEDGRLYGHVHMFINGRDVQFYEEKLDVKIYPEDVITIFPAVGGG
jgi:molybdopterin synthase sulfur carrier subunit